MSCVLRLTGVSKSYGALKVTDNISFAIEQGETYGILGPNGAGKTTLFNLISGDVRPDTGTIEFDGADIGKLAPYRRCMAGIGRSYQVPRPFGGMTVFENLLVGATFGGGLKEREAADLCIDVLERTGLKRRADQLAGSLTLLDRKRLELARALASRPKLLLLDEVAGGLVEHECDQLVALIRDVRKEGVAIIWIEHIVHALIAVVDRVVVLHGGQLIADGDPTEVV